MKGNAGRGAVALLYGAPRKEDLNALLEVTAKAIATPPKSAKEELKLVEAELGKAKAAHRVASDEAHRQLIRVAGLNQRMLQLKEIAKRETKCSQT